MTITNKQQLPEVLIKILENDQYSGKGQLTATSLIGDPHIFYLQNKHYDDIVTDATDRIWTLLGKGVHAQFEHAGSDFISEQRFHVTIADPRLSEPVNLSAQIDSFNIKTKELTDIKVTSIYNSGTKLDWQQQLNIQAYCMVENGVSPSSLSILKIYRDWHKKDAFSADKPNHPAEKVTIPLWSKEQQKEFIVNRILHFKNYAGEPCSPENRWSRPDKFAVNKPEAPRARKVFDTKLEAEMNLKPGEIIEFRKGADGKCEEYCEVNLFCPYYIQTHLVKL